MTDEVRIDDGGAIIDRFYGALASGDLDTAMACLTRDARIWHCFDGVELDRAAALEGFRAMIAGFPERAFVDARRHPLPNGFVQQHMMTARTPAGALVGWPICIIVRLSNGLIARIDEYIDRAGRHSIADLHNARVPGLA